MAWPPTRQTLTALLRPRAEHAVALLAFGLALYSQWPTFENFFVVNNDTRMHTFWMAQWRHPELFPNDLITTYARAYQPWGYWGLYRLVSFLGSPLFFSRALPLLLLPALAVALFRLGWDSAAAAPRAHRWVAGAVVAAWGGLAPVVLQKMAGGHARAFALPFLALACWLVVRRAWRALGLTLFVASLFYPVVAILGGLTAVLSSWEWTHGRPRFTGGRALVLSLALAGLSAGSVVALRSLVLPAEIGPVASRADIEGQPEFGRDGVYPVFPTPSPWVIAAQELRRSAAALPPSWTETAPRGESVGGKAGLLDWMVFAVVAALLALARPLRLPTPLLALFAAGFLAFFLADLTLMQLYLPVRYLQYALRLGLPWLMGLMALRLVELVPRSRLRAVAAGLALALPLVNLGALDGVGLEDYGKRKKLYTFLARTPPNALVAAHPMLADGIPLFSLRRVYVDFEHAQPFYPRYWRAMKARTRAFFAAYYAPDQESICRFLEHEGISHLVVERRHFKMGYLIRERLYFEPFHTEIRARVLGRDDFFLRRLPRSKAVYWQGETAVVTPGSLGCLAPSLPPPSPPPENPEAAPP